jgi:hypothetical protein
MDDSFSSDRQDVTALTSARELEEEAVSDNAAALPASVGMSQEAHVAGEAEISDDGEAREAREALRSSYS